MKSLWRGIVGTIFWSYERGSWPYDVMVLAILAFVLLTPRSWFHDQPQLPAHQDSQVRLIAQDSANQTRTYRVEAALLDTNKRGAAPAPELERKTHDVLSRNVDDLRGRRFQVVRINAVRAGDGSIESYDVIVRP